MPLFFDLTVHLAISLVLSLCAVLLGVMRAAVLMNMLEAWRSCPKRSDYCTTARFWRSLLKPTTETWLSRRNFNGCKWTTCCKKTVQPHGCFRRETARKQCKTRNKANLRCRGSLATLFRSQGYFYCGRNFVGVNVSSVDMNQNYILYKVQLLKVQFLPLYYGVFLLMI